MSPILEAFLARIHRGEPVAFGDTLRVIGEHYDYHPVRFWNGVGEGRLSNAPGVNEGSCKIFYFARLHGLSEMETLALFGEVYRDEVLGNPEGDGHQNIRTFLRDGWRGIDFDGAALSVKTPSPAGWRDGREAS